MKPYRAITRLAIAAALAAPLAGAPPAAAQQNHIIAVVNDEVVSRFDLDQGVKLELMFLGRSATPEERRRKVPQVLRRLINQRLFLQEAKRYNISVSDADVEREISRLEKSEGFSGVPLKRRLRVAGISLETLKSQLRSEVAWRRLVRVRLSSQRLAIISDDEVDEELERIKATQGTPEYRASEIFLVVESIDEDAPTRADARRLVEEIRAGTSFSSLARQFSNGSTAARGGDMGWIQERQLSEEVVAALTALEPGEVSNPIRSNGGYLILRLRERRLYSLANPDDTKVSLKQILLRLPKGASEDEAKVSLSLAETIRSTVTDCDDMTRVAAEIDPSTSGELGTVRLGDLPPDLRHMVRDLPIGSISQPALTESGVRLLMVCERVEPEVDLPDRAVVRRKLAEIKAEPIRRRYHRDLLRAAYRDIRI